MRSDSWAEVTRLRSLAALFANDPRGPIAAKMADRMAERLRQRVEVQL